MSNPLFDTLFRPTTASPTLTSAAPVRAPGTRTRAGNAMPRTRAALLYGAARAVEVSGTKITMAQVAAAGGVAKATLYNHFRTRDAVLAALLVAEVDAVVDAQAGKLIEAALTDAAAAISDHPVRRGLARLEPTALAAVGRIDPAADGWARARAGVAELLGRSGLGGVDTVLRWLASFLLSPGSAAAIAADVAVLVAGLPPADVRADRPLPEQVGQTA
jgi:AcrR family transcriptional regulator